MITKPGISLTMIVKDEEAMLPDCLKSVEGLVDEIIIVDTGSTDNTVIVAQKLGATVYAHPWQNSFSEARNYALQKSHREWALLLDADERLMQEDREKLTALLSKDAIAGAHFKLLNYLGNGKSGQYTTHNALRLLRNDGTHCFSGDIHEQIARADGGPIDAYFELSDIRLIHLGYLDSVSERKHKRARNLALLQSALKDNPDDPFTLFNLGNEYMAQKDFTKALDFYNHALEYYDAHQAYSPHLLFRRAMCLYELKRYGVAIQALDKGLKIYAGCTDMQYLKGQILMDQHRDVLAAESLERAIDMGEPHSTLRFMDGCATTRPYSALALLMKRQRHYKKAFQYFSMAIASDNTLHFAFYGAAECLDRMGLSPEDVDESLLSLFSDKNNVPNLVLLTDALLSRCLIKPALRHIERMRSAEGFETEVAFLSGKALLWQKGYREAGEHLRRALLGNPPRVLTRMREEASKFLALLAIIGESEEECESAAQNLSSIFGDAASRTFRQMRASMTDTEAHFLEASDAEQASALLCSVLETLLRLEEFERFEKLLSAFNYIESNTVLIALADVYRRAGYNKMAADTLIRSIRELSTFTPESAFHLSEALTSEDEPFRIKTS